MKYKNFIDNEDGSVTLLPILTDFVKQWFVCPECNSEDVAGLGNVIWDKEKNDWVHNGYRRDMDSFYCYDCCDDVEADFIDEEEFKLRQVKNKLLGDKDKAA
jgi:hypothetical protein